MERKPEGLIASLGVPFLSSRFEAAGALLAVARVRAALDARPDAAAALERYLDPLEGYRIARERYASHPSLDAVPLTPAEASTVREALDDVMLQVPSWQDLFSLPIYFLRIADDRLYSLTNPSIPQMVFLGRQALDSPEDLRETLVHELAHVWLGLLHEVSPLVHNDDGSKHTLPSGTANKSSLGVILAAHFAAAGAAFHLRRGPSRLNRVTFLRTYLRECLPLLTGQPALTVSGRLIWDHLKAFSHSLDRACAESDAL